MDRRTAVGRAPGAVNCVAVDEDGLARRQHRRRRVWWPPCAAATGSTRPGGGAWSSAPAARPGRSIAALADAGAAEVVVVNRTPERAAAAAALAGAGRTGGQPDGRRRVPSWWSTPRRSGMADVAGGRRTAWPLDPALLGAGQVVVDLVYHPPVTPWLAAARDRGATVANGLGHARPPGRPPDRAGWTGLEPPVEAMWAAVGRARPGQG